MNWEKHFKSYNPAFGADDAAIQARLNELGANPQLVVDGVLGAKSREAIKAFQRSKGLTIDGIPGPQTLSALGLQSGASVMGASASPSAKADAEAYQVAKRAGAASGMTEKQIQYVLTVAKGEGGYGKGWANPSASTIARSERYGLTGYEGKDSNNWGAVQGYGNAGSFQHVDSHADGSDYVSPYKRYATPEDGFLDMARIILNGGKRGTKGASEIKDAIAKGNLKKAVNAQHANGYFELDPQKYLAAVLRNYATLTTNLNWSKLLAENGVFITGAGLLAIGAGVAGWLLMKKG